MYLKLQRTASLTRCGSECRTRTFMSANADLFLDGRRFRRSGGAPPSITAEEAIARTVSSRNNIFVHTAAAAPQKLVKAVVDRADELSHVTFHHLHTEGPADYTNPKHANSFFSNNFFIGSNARKAVQSGDAGFVPVFLSEVPALFATGTIPIDVALVQVSPPDKHGHVSLGCSVDVSIDAVHHAKHVVALVNPNMPRAHGHGILHINEIDYIVESNEPLHEHPNEESELTDRIARNVSTLVEDRACIQLGIGALSNAVCKYLEDKCDLSLHSEMVGDGVVNLIKKGVITNRFKDILPDVNVVSFAMGNRELYDLLDDNLSFHLLRTSFTNNIEVIKRIRRMTSINSAIEIDLTGQVCADSIGTKMYSGFGGQVDFVRGASQSENGKAIIALPSVTSSGISKIAPVLKPGAGVVTSRAHVHYVVTEHGIAYLWGKNLQQRAKALIEIAHPNHQEELEKAATELYGWNKNWMIHWQQSSKSSDKP